MEPSPRSSRSSASAAGRSRCRTSRTPTPRWAQITVRSAAAISYESLGAFAGTGIGEHVGLTLMAVWGAFIAIALRTHGYPRALTSAGLVLSVASAFGEWGAFTLPDPLSGVCDAVFAVAYTTWNFWLVAVAWRIARSEPAGERRSATTPTAVRTGHPPLLGGR